MSESRIKLILGTLTLVSLTFPVFAEITYTPVSRDASFLAEPPDTNTPTPAFSGLAAAPPELVPPPAAAAPAPALAPTSAAPPPSPSFSVNLALPPQTPAPTSSAAPPPATTPPPDKPANTADITATAPAATVAPAPLQGDASESIGTANSDNLPIGMWKGTPRDVALRLLSFATLTNAPDLNRLMERLLMTAATPPEGTAEAAQSLTAMRVEKLVTFGDAATAWSLATHANADLIDDITFHFAAEANLAGNLQDVCPGVPALIKARSSVDWQKALAVCEIYARDAAAAKATLDAMRATPNRDDIFLEVADKGIFSDSKKLPYQLTPLTPPMLALLRLTGLPLPGELYGHPDYALVPALLNATPKQDVAQLGLAERAAARGVINNTTLGTVYRSITFTPDQLGAPLIAAESGSHLRALLYQAAIAEKSESKRIAYTVRFLQTAAPDFLNGAGAVMGDMLGTIKADPLFNDNAAVVAQIYMLAGRGDSALDWLHLARRNSANALDLQNLWPQLTLAGLEMESDYAADLNQWLDAALKPADPQADIRAARDNTAAVLLLLDATGFIVPDRAWARVLAAPHNEKHIALSPVLLTRLQEAAAAGHIAETVLLAVDLAGDGDIPLPASLAITRALRAAGFKSEAATFARHTVALTVKTN